MSVMLDLFSAVPASAIEPRPYQIEAIEAVFRENDEGCKRQLGVAATGLGKTIVFAEVARRFNTPTLILAHRDELIQQAVSKLQLVWPDVPVGVVKAKRDEHDMPLVVASVQTLARQGRLDRIPKDRFRLVIVDEAHHAIADSYRRVLDHFGCFAEEGGPLLFGVTATPDRGDKLGLHGVFDKIVFRYDMRWGIKNDYLSDLRAKQVMLRLDLDGVKKTHGDYQDGALGEALMAADAPAHIVSAWFDYARERKTLCFTPTVAVASELCDEYLRAGVRAAWVSGDTPIDERRSILKRFTSGEIQVLSNCAVLTEGYDEPSVNCVVMARPTQSRPFYQQMVGRGTRKYPGKTDCLILDVVGVTKRHSLATAASLIGADPAKMEKGQSAKASIDAQDNPKEKAAAGTLVDEDVDLWAQFEEATFAWVRSRTGFALSLVGGVTVTLQQMGAGWGVVIYKRDEKGEEKRFRLKSTASGLPIEMSQGLAEDYCRRQIEEAGGSVSVLIGRDAAWRKGKATSKQIGALRKWKVPFASDITKGEAADLLTAKIAGKQNR